MEITVLVPAKTQIHLDNGRLNEERERECGTEHHLSSVAAVFNV